MILTHIVLQLVLVTFDLESTVLWQHLLRQACSYAHHTNKAVAVTTLHTINSSSFPDALSL